MTVLDQVVFSQKTDVVFTPLFFAEQMVNEVLKNKRSIEGELCVCERAAGRWAPG